MPRKRKHASACLPWDLSLPPPFSSLPSHYPQAPNHNEGCCGRAPGAGPAEVPVAGIQGRRPHDHEGCAGWGRQRGCGCRLPSSRGSGGRRLLAKQRSPSCRAPASPLSQPTSPHMARVPPRWSARASTGTKLDPVPPLCNQPRLLPQSPTLPHLATLFSLPACAGSWWTSWGARASVRCGQGAPVPAPGIAIRSGHAATRSSLTFTRLRRPQPPSRTLEQAPTR